MKKLFALALALALSLFAVSAFAADAAFPGNLPGRGVFLPMTQEDLARKMQFMGMDMTALIISRIEKNQRHVCDAELLMLAKALGVSMDWLCGNE